MTLRRERMEKNRLIYSLRSLMKHPQDTLNDKNVFFVCFRYFQRVNIFRKIIDWVLTVLCFRLRHSFTIRSSSEACLWVNLYLLNCLPIKSHRSAIRPIPFANIKILEKSLFPSNRKLSKFLPFSDGIFYDLSMVLMHIMWKQ